MRGIGSLKGIGLMVVLCWVALVLPAQMSVKQEKQPTQLVKEVLVGKGIVADNVRFAGMIQALGEFSNPAAQPFFSSGIVLSTGNAVDMVGPNDNPKTSTVNGSPGDKNLYSLAGGRTFDGASLEFDFKAEKDSVTFNFVFASEEYNDYVGSTFNDVFALVVTGAGFGTGKNLAVIPGTNAPITVNSINPNENRQYFVDNNPFTLVGRINETAKANLNQAVLSNFEYDGMTKVLSVGFRVVPRQVYHFEMVVADAGDGTVDSAVLLEGGSFKSLEQEKHAIRRAQIAAQQRADSLARVQATADSLAHVQAVADSLEMANKFRLEKLAQEEAIAEQLRRTNQARLDSIAQAERMHSNHHQDSIDKARAAQFELEMDRQRQQDSIIKMKREQPQGPAPIYEKTPLGNDAHPLSPEFKETLTFEQASYYVPAHSEERLRQLGKILAAQPDLRAGIFLPQGEPIEVLNMRYDMIRFEMVKAGAKTTQIFRNGFSFAAAEDTKSIHRAEIWIRKE